MKEDTQRWRYWLPALLLMAIIFATSSLPGKSIPRFTDWDIPVNKGGHALGYGLLGAAYLFGLTRGSRGGIRHAAVALGLAILYALTDEFHQLFTPGRGAALADVGIDAAGAAGGILVRNALHGLLPLSWAAARKRRAGQAP